MTYTANFGNLSSALKGQYLMCVCVCVCVYVCAYRYLNVCVCVCVCVCGFAIISGFGDFNRSQFLNKQHLQISNNEQISE